MQCRKLISAATTFSCPKYVGQKIPHLCFEKDQEKIVAQFQPYSAEIGPLDLVRINAMCLIEIPESFSDEPINLSDTVTEYASIGQFYDALLYGIKQLKHEIKGGINQVDFFKAFYRNMPSLLVTEDGADGFDQVELLIQLITDQGEGDKDPSSLSKAPEVLVPFQNTADDIWPQADHFEKFVSIKAYPHLPEVFNVTSEAEYSPEQKELETIAIKQFDNLLQTLSCLFSGQSDHDFFPSYGKRGSSNS